MFRQQQQQQRWPIVIKKTITRDKNKLCVCVYCMCSTWSLFFQFLWFGLPYNLIIMMVMIWEPRKSMMMIIIIFLTFVFFCSGNEKINDNNIYLSVCVRVFNRPKPILIFFFPEKMSSSSLDQWWSNEHVCVYKSCHVCPVCENMTFERGIYFFFFKTTTTTTIKGRN